DQPGQAGIRERRASPPGFIRLRHNGSIRLHLAEETAVDDAVSCAVALQQERNNVPAFVQPNRVSVIVRELAKSARRAETEGAAVDPQAIPVRGGAMDQRFRGVIAEFDALAEIR